jgi:hypothetical protein
LCPPRREADPDISSLVSRQQEKKKKRRRKKRSSPGRLSAPIPTARIPHSRKPRRPLLHSSPGCQVRYQPDGHVDDDPRAWTNAQTWQLVPASSGPSGTKLQNFAYFKDQSCGLLYMAACDKLLTGYRYKSDYRQCYITCYPYSVRTWKRKSAR